MTDLESYRERLLSDLGIRELTTYEAHAEPPYFYEYQDDGAIYVHARFLDQPTPVVGIFSLEGAFIYGGPTTPTH